MAGRRRRRVGVDRDAVDHLDVVVLERQAHRRECS
jgi:hypothetical protein